MHHLHALLYPGPVGKNIQMRAVPDDVHRELRIRAATAGMSMSDYLREELARIASRPPIADVLSRASNRHGGASHRDIVAALRAERDDAHQRR